MQYYPRCPFLNLRHSPPFLVGVTFALFLGLHPLVMVLRLVANVEPLSSIVLGAPPPGLVIDFDLWANIFVLPLFRTILGWRLDAFSCLRCCHKLLLQTLDLAAKFVLI